ncbi:hypothetical protein [Salisaeta longa]|uniref:hypothetical protein n=1 Tax=Salisaeta longa TaxID=503170 RepID=UPI0003B58ED1|nr:hypothetical protein [Salisaeta longa]
MDSQNKNQHQIDDDLLPPGVWKLLQAPFKRDDVVFRDMQIDSSVGRGLCRPVIDEFALFDRFNTVLGPENWSLSFSHETENIYRCRLTIGTAHRDGMARAIDPLEACLSAVRKAMLLFGIGVGLHGPPDIYVERASGGQILNAEDILNDLASIGAIRSESTED